MLKKFQLFHMQRSTWIFTVILLHWCHKKITRVPDGEIMKMYEAKKISITLFQRYRGPKFIVFFKMAPVPCDPWRHNYQLSLLSKKIHTVVKISCQSDLPFLRKWFSKRKNPKIAGGKRINSTTRIKQNKNNRLPSPLDWVPKWERSLIMLHLPLSHMWYSLLFHNALLFYYLNRLLSIWPLLRTLPKNPTVTAFLLSILWIRLYCIHQELC